MSRRIVLPRPNAHVAVDVDVPAFVALLLDRLGQLPTATVYPSDPVDVARARTDGRWHD